AGERGEPGPGESGDSAQCRGPSRGNARSQSSLCDENRRRVTDPALKGWAKVKPPLRGDRRVRDSPLNTTLSRLSIGVSLAASMFDDFFENELLRLPLFAGITPHQYHGSAKYDRAEHDRNQKEDENQEVLVAHINI